MLYKYGTETCAMKVDDMERQERMERTMVRWMCGVLLRDRKSSVVLLERLSVVGVTEVDRRGRLRWYGHLHDDDDDDITFSSSYQLIYLLLLHPLNHFLTDKHPWVQEYPQLNWGYKAILS